MITAEEAARIEPVRQRVDEVLRHLELTENLDRQKVSAAVSFRTSTSMKQALDLRAELYHQEVSTEVINLETTMPSGAAGLLLYDVESVIRGELMIQDYLDPATRAFREDGQAEERPVKFVLTLPKDMSVVEPIPVVLFGHGLMTSRELLYLIASPLASAGYAALAIDLPYHGDRSVCLRESSCEEGASCDEVGQCRFDDGSEAEMVHVSVPFLSPLLEGTQYDELLNYPINSGEVFIDIENIVATRDHFAQAMLDLNQAVRVLRGPELGQAVIDHTGLWLGDGKDVEILYLGMSLGGILGSGLTAVEPEINDFVLNVPAADLTRLIEHSTAFHSSFEHALHDRDLERGTDDYFQFLNIVRWVLDPIDPLNLVQHAIQEPWAYEDPQTGDVLDDRQARVLIQMAEGDLVVPNIGTEVLSQRMGLPLTAYSPLLTDHAFLFDPNPLASSSRTAREDMIEFFDAR